MKKSPRPHQKEAIKAVVKGFKAHDRGKLIMACGTGKTLVANWIREKMKARVTVLMAPSNALLAQTLREWRAASAKPFEAMAVRSDPSVGADDVNASEIGAAVTTDPSLISTFLKQAGQRVLVCTYQSSDALRAAMDDLTVPAVDLLVSDEAHRTTGSSENLFPTCVHPTKIRASKRLFMTATQRCYFEADNGDEIVVSMDDMEHYGPTLYELTFASAIEQKLLTEYEIRVVFCTTEEAEKLIKDNPQLSIEDRRIRATDLAARIALLRAMESLGLRRMISFHRSVASAKATAETLPLIAAWMPKGLGPAGLFCETVNHHMDMSDRHALLRQFVAATSPAILTNARCLGEGVDVPAVDGVVFLDPRQSRIDIVQAVGRALRLSPTKERSVIVLPVIVDGSGAEQFNGAKFREIKRVTDALRAHDPTITEQLESYKQRGSSTSGSIKDRGDRARLMFDVPEGCDPRIAEWFVTRVQSHVPWETMFEAVSTAETLTAAQAEWVKGQRNSVRRGFVTPAKAERLKVIFARFPCRVINPADTLDRMYNDVVRLGWLPNNPSYKAFCVNHVYRSRDRRGLKTWITPELQAKLDVVKAAPSAKEQKYITQHRKNADELDRLVTTTGFRPGVGTKLNGWLRTCITKLRKASGTCATRVRDAGWFHRMWRTPTMQRDAHFKAKRVACADRMKKNLALVKAFVSSRGYLPSAVRPKEKSVALKMWEVHKVRVAEAAPYREELKALMENTPTWKKYKAVPVKIKSSAERAQAAGGRTELRVKKLLETLRSFIKSHGYFPSATKPKERSLKAALYDVQYLRNPVVAPYQKELRDIMSRTPTWKRYSSAEYKAERSR